MVGLIGIGITGSVAVLRDKSNSTFLGVGSAISSENVAPLGVATSSSVYSASYPAAQGNDNSTSLFHTAGGDLEPYWNLVLPETKNVQRIHISTQYNPFRLSRSWVMMSPNPISGTLASPVSVGLIKVQLPVFTGVGSAEIDVPISGRARYFRIWQDGAGDSVNPSNPYVHFNEFQIFA
jgi:hypothetical protein